MLPNTKITIKNDGETIIDGQEQSDQCYKLSESAGEAGKILKKEKKEHPPAHQIVHRKGV